VKQMPTCTCAQKMFDQVRRGFRSLNTVVVVVVVVVFSFNKTVVKRN